MPAPSRPSSVRRASGLPACIVIGVWLLAEQSTERITLSLSAIEACSGRCSVKKVPGTFVATVAKGLRISCGASGFGSHMSMWLGPPESQNMMTDLGLRPADSPPASARPAKIAGSETPATPASPVCKNHRREPTRIVSRAAGASGMWLVAAA
jgi:hypothetical protein